MNCIHIDCWRNLAHSLSFDHVDFWTDFKVFKLNSRQTSVRQIRHMSKTDNQVANMGLTYSFINPYDNITKMCILNPVNQNTFADCHTMTTTKTNQKFLLIERVQIYGYFHKLIWRSSGMMLAGCLDWINVWCTELAFQICHFEYDFCLIWC